MDRIVMDSMEFFTPHGVHPAARELGTHLWLSVVLELDASDAIRSDNLEDTVDVEEAYDIIREIVETRAWRLLESLGGQVAERLLQLDRVQRATVSVERRDTRRPGFRAYGVEVARER